MTFFDELEFIDHATISNAVAAKYQFENGYSLSIVAMKTGDDFLLHGNVTEGEYEVALIDKNGNISGSILGWRDVRTVNELASCVSVGDLSHFNLWDWWDDL